MYVGMLLLYSHVQLCACNDGEAAECVTGCDEKRKNRPAGEIRTPALIPSRIN